MTTYRRRPAEIEAVQWTDTNPDELTAFAGQQFMTVDPEDRVDNPDATAALLESAHSSWADLEPSDWVVKRGDDFAVLTAEEFADLYEPTDGGALRDRIASAIHADLLATAYRRDQGLLGIVPRLTDAVLSVLPAIVDRADDEPPLSPDYQHPACGFHWHGKDGTDIPMRDGQPVCPRCEIERLRERHKASLRRADKLNNELMEEVQRYADGTERPVLWSVYNQMHLRALKTETTLERVQKVARRLAAHAVGFKDVLDDSDRAPWAKTVGADIAELIEVLPDQPTTPPAGGAPQPRETDGEHVVAYRSPLPGALSIYCTRHTDELGDGVRPLTSDDLPDGGVCVSCGADVLIPPQPKEA